jgi:hypothetical protein
LGGGGGGGTPSTLSEDSGDVLMVGGANEKTLGASFMHAAKSDREVGCAKGIYFRASSARDHAFSVPAFLFLLLLFF